MPKRIFWAIQGVILGPRGVVTVNQNTPFNSKTKLNPIHGLQNVGITTNFNLEQVFEMGQLSLYENIEEVPEVEVTLEKVLDGYPLIYHLATCDTSVATGDDTLIGRSNARCDLRMGVYAGTAEKAGAANPQAEVYCSGMYVSSVSYTFPVDGNMTEAVTLVGNHTKWFNGDAGAAPAIMLTNVLGFGDADGSPALDTPVSGVQRREDLIITGCTLPDDIPGVTSGAMTKMHDASVNDTINTAPAAHIQNISVSADMGREPIMELGHKGPYYRYVSWPVEVTSEFEVITGSGAHVNALPDADNLTSRTIKLQTKDSSIFDLGTKNKLTSVSYGGADTGGGNATVTYSYSTWNTLSIFNIKNPTNS